MPTALQSLLDPITPIEFRERYYGKQPLLVRGHPEKFAGLFTWDDLNRLLNGSPYPLPQLEISTPEKRKQAPPASAVIEECRAGASLIIHHLQLCDPKVGELTRALESAMGEELTTGLFVSQPSRAALSKHYDRADVFVLQLAGFKAWSVYDPSIDKPDLHTPKDPNLSSPPHPSLQCELAPGDVLYVPRGHWHEALAQRQMSLHLNIAVHSKTGIDFLTWLVDQLRNDVRFRDELPLWLAGEPMEVQEQRLRERVAELGEILLARLADVETVQRYIEHRVMSDRDIRRFKLPAQILEAPLTQFDVRRFSRPAHQRFVLRDGSADGTISLSVWGHVFHFPKNARPLIDFILSRTAFAYEDARLHAGELMEQGVRDVLELLLREGILDAEQGP